MTALTTALRGRTRTRVAASGPPKVLRRETHQPDYVILVAVIAMSAIGILMVFSSSAMKEFTRDGDVFGAVAPQVAWGVAGLLAMLAMMRIDYRRLRLVSIPMYAIAVVLLMLVFVPSLGQVVGGSARWLKIGPLPAVHPAEFAKLALVIYLAHWLAKRGTGVGGLLGGTLPFLVIFLPIVALVLKEPDLGTSMVLATTGLTMFVLAGGNLVHFAVLVAGGIVGIVMFALRGYQLERIRAWIDPWADPAGIGFHSVQGLLALGSGGLLGLGLGQSRGAGGLFLPNASNDFIFAVIGEEFGLLGAGLVIVLFVVLAYQGDPDRAGRARHVRGAPGRRDHDLAVRPGVHQHRRRGGPLPDHRDHPAVHQCRRLLADDQPGGRRDPALDLPRDHRTRHLERCVC